MNPMIDGHPSPAYRHTQIGYTMIYTVGSLTLASLILMAVLWQLGQTQVLLAVSITMLVVCGLCLPLFHSLTVIVQGDALEIRFGIGVLSFRFPLRDIVSATPARDSWRHGWGIHWIGDGWLYNVSRWDAVEICMRNGKRNQIGTDEPERLAEAIQQAIQQGIR
jgi:hypothetical protein